MYRKILDSTIVWLLLIIAGGSKTTLAGNQAISSQPPDLAFIYYGDWWSADSFSAEAATYRTVAGDFDGDGLGDIAMLHRTNDTTMRFYVMLGAGDHFDWQGIWLVVSDFLNADMVTGRVVAGDFNNDSYDDIAAFADDSETVLYVFLSDGSGAFTYQDWWSGDGNYDARITGRVVAGDFDGDGWVDDIAALYDATGDSSGLTIRADVFLSDGSGFRDPEDWWSAAQFSAANAEYRTVAGDMDADGDDDVVMIFQAEDLDGDGVDDDTNVYVLRASEGAFSPRIWWKSNSYIAGRTTGRVVAGDFDGDGDDDVALLYDYFNLEIRGHVLLSTRQVFSYQGSDPGWWKHTAYNAPWAEGRVVAGDWDGDGVDDVSMIYHTNLASPTVRAHVLKATAPSPQPSMIRQVDADDPACSDDFGGPYCSIQAAVDAASDGDTIQVASGGYFEHVNAPKYSDPGFNQALTIQGAGAASTFVDASDNGSVFTVHPGGDITLRSLTIRNGNSGYGGGIYIYFGIFPYAGAVTVRDSALVENFAEYDGGGIYNEAGVVTISDSTFSDNASGHFGGGIYSTFGVVNVSNSTFSRNSAGDGGGGIFSTSESTLTVINSTLSGNTSGGFGGSVRNNSMATFVNSIIANSTAGGDCAGSGTWDTVGSPNLESDGSCPSFTLTGDPLLGPLQDNGGPTQTHALLKDSPAIDAGNNAACPATDQRGVPRPQDGDSDGVAVCDLGAFESSTPGIYLPLVIKNP